MTFDQLILEFQTHSKFDDVINSMIGTEDPQTVQDVLSVKEAFWKAYYMAKDDEAFSLDDWNRYQAEVIHGHLDDYIGMSSKAIADDFLIWAREVNTPEPGDFGYQQKHHNI